jgi:spermidine/putrescine transport system substrate-binding protein
MTSYLRSPLRARGMNRRALLRKAATLGLAAVAFPVMARPAGAAGEITYYTWSGYDVPELHKDYAAKYGGPPNFVVFGNEAEALERIRSGFQPQVVHPCIYDLGRWRDADLIRPIDTGRIKAWPDVFASLKAAAGDEGKGSSWLVPFDWGNASVLYRTDLVDPAIEDSWSIMFDERYAGKLAMWDSIDGAVNVAALVAGVANPFDMTDAELAKVRDLLVKQKALLRFYWNDQSEAEQALASGEVVAAYTWNSSLLNLKKQGLPVRYMLPKERILTWVCGMVWVKPAEAMEQEVYDFFDSMLDPETTGHYLIDSYGYGHSNAKSFGTVTPARLEELALPPEPEEMFKKSLVLSIMDTKVRQKYITMYEQVKAGI